MVEVETPGTADTVEDENNNSALADRVFISDERVVGSGKRKVIRSLTVLGAIVAFPL